VTGPILTKINTFRSTEAERETWDREVETGGFKDFTAFVRTRLNGRADPAVEAEEGAAALPATPAPAPPPPRTLDLVGRPAHHPRCSCRICAPKQG